MLTAFTGFFSPPPPKKSVVLVRISDKNSQSSVDQKWQLMDYITKNNIQNYNLLQTEESASKSDRFPKYLEPLTDKSIGKVYVTAVDRFSRSYVNVVSLMNKRDGEELTIHDIYKDKSYTLSGYNMPKDFKQKIIIAEQEARGFGERSIRSHSVRKAKREDWDRVPLEAWELIEGEVQDFLIKDVRFSEIKLIDIMYNFFNDKGFAIPRSYIKMLYQNLDKKPKYSTVMTCSKCGRRRMVSSGYAKHKGSLFECIDLNHVKCDVSEDLTDIFLEPVIEDTREMDYETDNSREWNFKRILESKKKKGVTYYNIEWNTGEFTWEPKSVIAESDPGSVLQYEKSLLDKKRNKRKETEISSGIFNMIISNTERPKKRIKNS